MDRTYIEIPVSIHDVFRNRFFKLTNMKIPVTCSKNEPDTHCLTGELKTHLTQAMKDTLQTEFPTVVFSDGWPVAWIPKE